MGDVVELNQTLCTVETNKAEVEIPSPYSGRIVALGGAEGETLSVGTLLVRIDTGVPEPRTPVSSATAPTTVWTAAGGRGPRRRCASWRLSCPSISTV